MPTERDPRITVRLTPELDAALRARAAEEGLKPSHVARRALEAALGGRGLETPAAVTTPCGSGSVKETRATENPVPPRASVNRGMACPPGDTLPPPPTGGIVFETDLTAGDVARTEWTPPDDAVQSWPPTGRSCEACQKAVGSATLKRCSCGGRIVPEPS